MFMEEFTNYRDSGYPVDILYLDFQKAFDKFPHCRLVSKVAAHRISGDVLRWIENCLSRKKQSVVLGVRCLSGMIFQVVYHRALFWVLFYLYYCISDIDDTVNSKILKFADNTRI